MTENIEKPALIKLPIKQKLHVIYISTIILLTLMAGASLLGIVFPSTLYPGKELSITFITNDVLNLLIGFPILLISMQLTKKGSLVGLLCYPGALFYITYVYATYLLGLAFNILFIPYLLIVTVSIYTMIALIISINSEHIRQILKGFVPVKTAGIILITIACLIIFYQIFSIIDIQIKKSEVNQLMLAQWIVDLAIASPAVLIIGFFMLRQKALGYSLGMSLLLYLSALFIGVIPFLMIEAALSSNPVDGLGILIVLTSSLLCLLPFMFFIRGIKRALESD